MKGLSTRARARGSLVRSTVVLTVVALGVVVVLAAGAAAFTDVPTTHSYAAAIEDLSNRGIINGFTDGTFGPGREVTRQQFAKMIVLTLSLPVTETDVAPFSDVGVSGPSTLYPDNYIAVAAQRGITNGTSAGHFSPGNNISRAQVVTMIVRAAENVLPAGTLAQPPAGYTGSLPPFSDIHAPNMRIAQSNGLLAGLVGFGAQWDPWAGASRGEVAQILTHLLALMPSTSSTTTTSLASTTSTTSNSTTSTTLPSTSGPFTKLQILLPGETAAPGTPSGKTGTPSTQTAGVPFTFTVNAVDADWNVVNSVTDVVQIAWSDGGPPMTFEWQLAAGTATFGNDLTAGSWTFTVTDVTDPGKTPSTSSPMTVTSG